MRVLVVGVLFAALQASQPAFHIVVLEGENAVNVIQQKTAVRPLIEVRDRNNVPVAGATVTFAIGSGQPAAFAGGLQTLTVTTNAAGQAAATGMSALGPGAVQINVSAAFQGQVATAAISQTNFATAAAAAQASSAAGASGGTGGSTGAATGGAAGGGGGISGTTIGIVGAAVAGGAVAATQVGGNKEDNGSASSERSYTGPFSGQFVMTTTTASFNSTSTCVSTRAISGNLTITLHAGNATGQLSTTGTNQEVSVSGPLCTPLPGGAPFNYNGDVTGGPSALNWVFQSSSSSTSPATVTVTVGVKFEGSLSGDTITGTLSYGEISTGSNNVNGIATTINGNGLSNFPVTLK